MKAPITPPYSPIVRAGDWLLVSGQVGVLDGRLIDGGFGAQFDQAMGNLTDRLAEHGADLGHVVKTTVFLRHLSDYDPMNELYAAAFGTHRPARSAVGVTELPMGALVEIEAWAWAPDGASAR